MSEIVMMPPHDVFGSFSGLATALNFSSPMTLSQCVRVVPGPQSFFGCGMEEKPSSAKCAVAGVHNSVSLRMITQQLR